MDFLNKSYAQLVDLFRSMTPGARIVSGLLLTVVVISLVYLFGHQSSSADTDLIGGGDAFQASQMPAMEAAFAKANLNGYQIEGNRIRVPRGLRSAYMGALADAKALPAHFGSYLTQVTDDASPFVSKAQQDERRKVALERELAQIISSMHGIESASVLYDSEVQGGLKEEKVVSASVSVKPMGNEPLDEDRVPMIRAVLAGAIAGLDPESVTVADLNSDNVFPAGKKGQPGSGSLDVYGTTKRMYEKEWEAKIRDALAFIPSVKVKVNVELNPELEDREEEINANAKTIPIEETEESSTLTTAPSATLGRPGVAAQQVANQGAVLSGSGGSKQDEETTKHFQRSIPSGKSSTVKKAPLTPRRVTVTVGVLSSYYEKIWQERNPVPVGGQAKPPDANALAVIETEEKKKIHDYVLQLIPVPPEVVPDPTPLVSVMTFQHIPVPGIDPPKFSDQLIMWLMQYWATLGMVLLGLISLVMLRSMVRAAPAAELPRGELAASTLSAAEEEAERAEEAEATPARLKRRGKTGRSMRDELVDIVREDPDAAANILRNWIGTTN